MAKGIIPIVELIISLLLIYTSISFFTPRIAEEVGWERAGHILFARDLLTSLDRLGSLYTLAFHEDAFNSFLVSNFPALKLQLKLKGSKTLPSHAWIACNCSAEQASSLERWTEGLQVNGRKIELDFCTTPIDLRGCGQDVRALLLFGYKPLQAEQLKTLLRGGIGVIEVADLSSEQMDEVQRQIFGLEWKGGSPSGDVSFARVPENSTELIYPLWKYFHYFPLNLRATSAQALPGCPSTINKGNFSFRNVSYSWCTCGQTVYFDTNKNGQCDASDLVLSVGQDFQLSDGEGNLFNFTLKGVGSREIKISFAKGYKFKNFLKSAVQPTNAEAWRIALSDASLPVAVLNQHWHARTIWLADPSKEGLKDDERHLLTVALLYALKESERGLGGTGYLNSYVDVQYVDMYEVYLVDALVTPVL